MRSIRLSLIAATAIAVAGSATAFAADTAGRSDIGTYSASPNYLRNPVPIVIGAGESRQIFYVEADSASAPSCGAPPPRRAGPVEFPLVRAGTVLRAAQELPLRPCNTRVSPAHHHTQAASSAGQGQNAGVRS